MRIKYVVAMGISQKFAAAPKRRDFLLLRVSIFDAVIIVTRTVVVTLSLLWFHFLWTLCEQITREAVLDPVDKSTRATCYSLSHTHFLGTEVVLCGSGVG